MKTIEQIYTPYDFSKTRCYVIRLEVQKNGFMKIEHKLPHFIKEMKGIFVSTDCLNSASNLMGIISLNFNGQVFKSYQTFVYKTVHLEDCSNPVEFNETILPTSYLQGFFYDLTKTELFPYTVSIYIHYANKEYKKP